MFILGCGREISATKIAYLIAEHNGGSKSGFSINSCSNNGDHGGIFINKIWIVV